MYHITLTRLCNICAIFHGCKTDNSQLIFLLYTWKKVREHLLRYEGKLLTIISRQSKYVLTKLFS